MRASANTPPGGSTGDYQCSVETLLGSLRPPGLADSAEPWSARSALAANDESIAQVNQSRCDLAGAWRGIPEDTHKNDTRVLKPALILNKLNQDSARILNEEVGDSGLTLLYFDVRRNATAFDKTICFVYRVDLEGEVFDADSG